MTLLEDILVDAQRITPLPIARIRLLRELIEMEKQDQKEEAQRELDYEEDKEFWCGENAPDCFVELMVESYWDEDEVIIVKDIFEINQNHEN